MRVFGIGSKAREMMKEYEAQINNSIKNLVTFFGEKHKKKCLSNLSESFFLLCDQEDRKLIKDISNLPETDKKFEDYYSENPNYRIVVRSLENGKSLAVDEIKKILVTKYFGEKTANIAWVISGDWTNAYLTHDKPEKLKEDEKKNFETVFNSLLEENKTFEEWTSDKEFMQTVDKFVHEVVMVYEEISNRYEELKLEIVKDRFEGYSELEEFIINNTAENQVAEMRRYMIDYLLNGTNCLAVVFDLDSMIETKTCRHLLASSVRNFEKVLEHENMHIVSTEETDTPVVGRRHSSGLCYFDSEKGEISGENVNELVTEFLAKLCTAKSKGENFKPAFVDGESSYHAAFPLLGDFLLENADYLKEFYIDNRTDELIKMCGEKNYHDLESALDKLFDACMNNEDVLVLLEIKKTLEKDGIIENGTSLELTMKVAEKQSGIREVLNDYIYENHFENFDQSVRVIDTVIAINERLKEAAKEYRKNNTKQPGTEE